MSFAKACLAAFAAIALSAIEAAAQKVELKLGHIGEPGSLYAQTAEEFAKRANAKLGDKAHVEIYGSSQLGSDKDLLQKLKLGQVQLWLASTIMSSVAPEFGVFEMPYIIKDRAHMRRVAAAMDAKVFGPAGRPRAYCCSALARMAVVTSPTVCVQFPNPQILPASSCAFRKENGGSRCSVPTALTRHRWPTARFSRP